MTSLIIVMTCKHVAPIRNRGSVGLSVGVIIMGMTQKSDFELLSDIVFSIKSSCAERSR